VLILINHRYDYPLHLGKSIYRKVHVLESKRFEEIRNAYVLTIRGNMEDRYRTGDIIELPSQGDVIVMGDIHGNRENFAKVLEAADLENNPQRHLIIQEATHTYQVEEDLSFLLHEDIVKVKAQFPHQLHILLGNHELSELTGKEILKGGICYNILFREGMKREYGEYYDVIKDLFDDYIKTMPLAAVAPNGIFLSHSIPDPKYTRYYSLKLFREGLEDQKKYSILTEKLVWGRDLSQENADAFTQQVESEIHVVGHTACKRGYQVPNDRHIVLDSKGLFATTLYFRLDKKYTQDELVKKGIQHINKKEVCEKLQKYKEKRKQQESKT
jgi:hypothetical protein